MTKIELIDFLIKNYPQFLNLSNLIYKGDKSKAMDAIQQVILAILMSQKYENIESIYARAYLNAAIKNRFLTERKASKNTIFGESDSYDFSKIEEPDSWESIQDEKTRFKEVMREAQEILPKSQLKALNNFLSYNETTNIERKGLISNKEKRARFVAFDKLKKHFESK